MKDISYYFVNLYKTVLEREKEEFNVGEEAIRNAIKVMKDAYLPNSSWHSKPNYTVVNYNGPAFRCAYLHKYAMCYTGMVFCLLRLAIDGSDEVFINFRRQKNLNFCSLGGGPGTDIVGIAAALVSRNIGMDSWSATIIDLAVKWKNSFSRILSELQYGCYGPLLRKMRVLCSAARYLEANLLGDWSSNSNIGQSIMAADVVLMVKFISAAACNYHTENMVKKVFIKMKPGAMLLFIENAAGGFGEMMKRKASECGLISIYGPLCHYEYKDSTFDISRFGSKSQSKSKVVFEVYQKPGFSRYTNVQPQNVSLVHKRLTVQPRYNYVPESYIQRRQQNNDKSALEIVFFCILVGLIIWFSTDLRDKCYTYILNFFKKY